MTLDEAWSTFRANLLKVWQQIKDIFKELYQLYDSRKRQTAPRYTPAWKIPMKSQVMNRKPKNTMARSRLQKG